MKQPIFRKYKILLLIISGVVSALPLVIDELGFVQWLSIVPMALVLVDISKDGESKLRRIYLLGLLFFESYFFLFHYQSLYSFCEFFGVCGCGYFRCFCSDSRRNYSGTLVLSVKLCQSIYKTF